MIFKKLFSLLFLLLYINSSLSYGQNAIKILFLGSSHGRNTIGQFPILAYHSGVDVICANAYAGGLPIKEVADLCVEGEVFRGLYKKFYDGTWHDNIPDMTILKMLQDEEWDVISIQRSAAEDRYWNDDQTQSIEIILKYIKDNCNYSPTIVFNSGFADSYSIPNRDKQQQETEDIYTSVQFVKNNYGIDIIPMAPVMQILRNNDELANLGTYIYHMLSFDSQHLDLGIGMYASACICYDFFLRGRFGLKVSECSYLPTAEDMIPFWYEENKFTPIDEKYAKTIREIVNGYYNSIQTSEIVSIKVLRDHTLSANGYTIDGRKASLKKGGIRIVDGKKIIQY